jgi:hypothetical protein
MENNLFENTRIHCPTEEIWNNLLTIRTELNLKNDGLNKWDYYKSNSYIKMSEIMLYGNILNTSEHIISYEYFLTQLVETYPKNKTFVSMRYRNNNIYIDNLVKSTDQFIQLNKIKIENNPIFVNNENIELISISKKRKEIKLINLTKPKTI